MAVQELEGYDEVVRHFLELLSPEKRLEGLAPEQRLVAFIEVRREGKPRQGVPLRVLGVVRLAVLVPEHGHVVARSKRLSRQREWADLRRMVRIDHREAEGEIDRRVARDQVARRRRSA